jgi:hypothetical protein
MSAITGTLRPRLPAFGRELLDLRRKGLVPNPPEVFVSVDSWDWAKNRTRVVVASDAEPADLDFSFVAGIDVWLGWWPDKTPIERRNATVRAILACLPLRVIMIAHEDTPRFVWIKSVQLGIELAEFTE